MVNSTKLHNSILKYTIKMETLDEIFDKNVAGIIKKISGVHWASPICRFTWIDDSNAKVINTMNENHKVQFVVSNPHLLITPLGGMMAGFGFV